jgi:hypothetical protein
LRFPGEIWDRRAVRKALRFRPAIAVRIAAPPSELEAFTRELDGLGEAAVHGGRHRSGRI